MADSLEYCDAAWLAPDFRELVLCRLFGMTNELEARTVKTVFLHTMPLLLVGYVLAYIDRVNVGFAALTMNKDLGISAYQYGLGAGLFYLSYSIFELPSNLLLVRFGPRRWFARIM